MGLGGIGILFTTIFALVVVFVIGSMVVHALLFGSVFYAVTRRISDSLDQQQAAGEAVRQASRCEFCGAARSADRAPCPGCGAPQQISGVVASDIPSFQNRSDV